VAEIIAEPWEIHSVSLSPADRPARVAELLQQVGLDPSLAQRFPTPATCPGRC
jgi:peptide/nickel transport system ATP-binding protein